jgi:hypothetical protein
MAHKGSLHHEHQNVGGKEKKKKKKCKQYLNHFVFGNSWAMHVNPGNV